jgi:hypothetical protein
MPSHAGAALARLEGTLEVVTALKEANMAKLLGDQIADSFAAVREVRAALKQAEGALRVFVPKNEMWDLFQSTGHEGHGAIVVSSDLDEAMRLRVVEFVVANQQVPVPDAGCLLVWPLAFCPRRSHVRGCTGNRSVFLVPSWRPSPTWGTTCGSR